MGDAQVESSAQDGTLGVDGPVVAEVLPQPERHRRQEQAAAPTTAIGHGPVAVLGGKVAGHHRVYSVLAPDTSLLDRELRLSTPLLERLGHDGQVVVAESLVDDLLPFISKAVEHREPVVACGLQGKVDIFECE